MYSYEDRIRAVKYYIPCGCNAAYTVRKLGYPSARVLVDWFREYSRDQDLHREHKKYSKFTDEEKRTAVDYYFTHGRNALKTVNDLGYPSRTLLLSWLKQVVYNDILPKIANAVLAIIEQKYHFVQLFYDRIKPDGFCTHLPLSDYS